MNKIEKAEQAFCKVRDILKADTEHRAAYNRAYKKPRKFYREHITEEVIAILISETED